jgi:hypothetical protein
MAHELPASLQYGFRYGFTGKWFGVLFILVQCAVTVELSPGCEQTPRSGNFIVLYVNKATSLEHCLSSKPSPECSRLVAGPGSGPWSFISELRWTASRCDGFFSQYCRFASNAPHSCFVTLGQQGAGVASAASLGQNEGKSFKCFGQLATTAELFSCM